ncbi:GRIP and coiled-coil domain-containing protein 2 [Quillaja saponaria]|uniref:GRIP and coiled-coil domain-containing protein 2 n=1 Tax=Quillaja saponaria TaxID=32244 RepID=A0AAD7LIN0_QUISA|nr:GRIP and coiled-coil domain-containing protein 2 [Quillaja saponaria]
MDKNKSRTDLLAAGRKKLQQYRQKKDGKGSGDHGKSSKKSSKPKQHEGDTDATATTSVSTALSQVTDGEVASGVNDSLAIIESQGPHSTGNSLTSDVNVPSVDSSTVPAAHGTGLVKSELDSNTKLALPGKGDTDAAANTSVPTASSQVTDGKVASGVDDSLAIVESAGLHSTGNSSTSDVNVPAVDSSSMPAADGTGVVKTELDTNTNLAIPEEGTNEHHSESLVPNEGESTPNVVADVAQDVSLGTSESFDTDAGARHSHMSVSVNVLPASVDAREDTEVGVETESGDREDQEPNGLDSKQSYRSSDIEIEGDKNHPLSNVGEGAQSPSAIGLVATSIKEASLEVEQLGEVVDVSSSTGEAMSDSFSASAWALPLEDDVSAATPIVTNQYTEILQPLSYEENSESFLGSSYRLNSQEGVQSGVDDMTIQEGHTKQYVPAGSVFQDKSHEGCRDDQVPNSAGRLAVSPVTHVSSVSLSQLIEVVKGLSEEEYDFLLKSRGEVAISDHKASSSTVAEHGLPEILERFKEELFLTNFMKDIFSLQLTEQLQLQMEFDNQCCQSFDEISRRRASLGEVSEKNQGLVDDLAHCQTELHDVDSRRDELQNQFHTAKAETEAFSARILELQNSQESSQKESSVLSAELADCKGLLRALQVENENLNENFASMTEEKKKLVEEKEFHLYANEKLSTELAHFKSLAEGLQVENSNLSGSLSSVTEERSKLEEEIAHISHKIERLSVELTDSKDLVASLQGGNANLTESLAFSADQMKKLEQDKQSIVLENERLSSELISLQEQLSSEKGEHKGFEVDLKEATMRLEQLSEENIFLTSSLDAYKAKLEEISKIHSQLLSEHREFGNQSLGSEEQSRDCEVAMDDEDSQPNSGKWDEGGAAERPPLKLLEQDVCDDSLGFVSLNERLGQVEKILEKLEKAIEVVHSHSASFSRSSGKVPAPAVSKLIQAFESKVHHDEHDVEENDSTEIQPSAESFMLTKGQIENLRALLNQLRLDFKNADALYRGERDGRKIGNAMYKELEDQFEALKGHTYNFEASNIELAVQYEAAKQHMGDIQEQKIDLENRYEALKQDDIRLKAENSELFERLRGYQSKITELHTQMYDIQQSSNEMASVIGKQLENLEKEATEREIVLQQGWNTTVSQIVDTVAELDKSIGEIFATTVSNGSDDGLDLNSRIAASVSAAAKVIEDLQKKLEASSSDHKAICTLYNEANEKCADLLGKNELAIGILHKLYGDLKKLVIEGQNEEEVDLQTDNLSYLLNFSSYEILMKKLENQLIEKLELETVNNELKLELIRKTEEFEELNKKCVDLNGVCKLIEDIQGILKLEDTKIDLNATPLLRLESLVSVLVQKYREVDVQLDLKSKVAELAELNEKIHHLDTLCLQHENEILILKESLSQAGEAIIASRSELHVKKNELEQSEQRVSSIREKLSIAVAKGKGLVVQRDGLKQSLSDASSELERCLQELQLKDTRLCEVETQLKTYAEAGERVEALESELSYIRNSATALRESFLLKDSVLQRIEEILEDLDLPEHFHSRDIIERVDWLARSATGNSLPTNEWDQKSSAEGGSYSDTGFVVMDAWKDDGQLQSISVDDFRTRFQELQSKFYGLAEQNEMLEQSLMERNSLLQRWEELLDRIVMPSHLRTMETEERIEWLGKELAETYLDRDSLQQKVDNIESYCGLLNADLEESQRRVSALEADLKNVTHDREYLSERMEILMHEHESHSEKTVQIELENGKLYNEVTGLQEKLVQKSGVEEQIVSIESKIRKLLELVTNALQESGVNDMVSGSDCIDFLEVSLRKLVENYLTLSSIQPVHDDSVDMHHIEKADATTDEAGSISMLNTRESDAAHLRKDLEEALCELTHLKEERDRNLEKHVSLSGEVESLSRRRDELQALLYQEEQKSVSVREKLNVAVRKGKSLVQQRDSLKQTIEQINNEMEHLKSEINNRDSFLAEYEQKFKDLSSYPDKVRALESESLFLKNRLAETEHNFQEREYTLSMIMNVLSKIEVVGDGNSTDVVKKVEWIGKQCSDLHAVVASLEQESRKSKRASDLLLAELNEVQERNDALQEELMKAADELASLKKEKDLSEAAKLEALSHLEKLSAIHSYERNEQISEFMGLKSVINKLWKGFSEVNKLLSDVSFTDLKLFQNLEVGLESCMKPNNAVDVSVTRGRGGIASRASDNTERFLSLDSWSQFNSHDQFNDNAVTEIFRILGHQLQEFLREFGALEETLNTHSNSVQEQANSLSDLVVTIQREMASQRESCEVMKRDVSKKDGELVALHKNIACLYEACSSLLTEVGKRKVELVGNNLEYGDLIHSKSASLADGELSYSGQAQFFSEEYVKTVADTMLSAVKDFASIKTEVLDANQREIKMTVSKLQRELQEKDIQKDRICMELVNQIKEAEGSVKIYSQDLQSSTTRVHNLEKHVEVIEAERKKLEERVNELQDDRAASTDLQEKIRSLTDLLAAKDQEIEVLMQALDEEEMQMEGLKNKIEELEKVVQLKSIDVENLEASRGKVMKKLSITVSKFDELHQFSASLLSEVENLQSQLQDRDAEISFLRQEVTRCTNDVLLASQMSHRSSDEVFGFLTWFDTILSQ